MPNPGSADARTPAQTGPDAAVEETLKMNAYVEAQTLIQDTTPIHDAMNLTSGGSLARIVLNGQVYSLRITRAGKLILTK
ncbi:hypothetical protein GCM10007315_26630 [Gemmobacter tilapiae]|jgi:hemin uptake protein HemP|uniref:Hemin uptake protein HemP n=2 Tax=Neogemmobacter tilapiae TaxID=875041 RepID=A0A918TXP8_9RHOB|nr:hypothetical protein GCM10007315_26630 [Gemmobacter tilapiae]